MLEKISHQHGKTVQQLTTENNRNKLALDVTFIHDRKDRYAPFADVTDYLKQQNTKLIATEGLGHSRILSDTTVINEISQVLSYR